MRITRDKVATRDSAPGVGPQLLHESLHRAVEWNRVAIDDHHHFRIVGKTYQRFVQHLAFASRISIENDRFHRVFSRAIYPRGKA